jgi:putative phage-type endonuclease
MYFDDYDDLENILDKIKPDEELICISEENTVDLTESILQAMDDYVRENPSAMIEEDFHETFIDDIKTLMCIQLNYGENTSNEIDDNDKLDEQIEILEDLIEDAAEFFYENIMPERSFDTTFIIQESKKDVIAKQLAYLSQKPQPAQRTTEWYEFRHNLITASNAYKAFESESTRNQLIYEKCQPVNPTDSKAGMVNINTPFHWGQKYEPLSVMIYEEKYGVKVGDFGCIQHDKYSFLGASPDGINIDETSPSYGRMLEIKNIVNRVIDGIPKKEYWVQMQLQMETCNLNECDFLETKFVEYEDTANDSAYYNFINDGTFNKSNKNQQKGVILYFAKTDGNPNYVYCPLHIQDNESFTKWEEEMIELYQSPKYKMVWIKNIYWKLEQLSCVLVLRNKEWFANSIDKLKSVWNTIEKERLTGYSHRAPNKKNKKKVETLSIVPHECLLTFNKTGNKYVVRTAAPPPINVIKIRTESFDDTKQNS